ncbi:MAG TPA: hypothetical protein VHC63_16130 [Acidimicrobiales bacterium]|nr:hypothetical protein [Acidimicrobiales bacterium]
MRTASAIGRVSVAIFTAANLGTVVVPPPLAVVVAVAQHAAVLVDDLCAVLVVAAAAVLVVVVLASSTQQVVVVRFVVDGPRRVATLWSWPLHAAPSKATVSAAASALPNFIA